MANKANPNPRLNPGAGDFDRTGENEQQQQEQTAKEREEEQNKQQGGQIDQADDQS